MSSRIENSRITNRCTVEIHPADSPVSWRCELAAGHAGEHASVIGSWRAPSPELVTRTMLVARVQQYRHSAAVLRALAGAVSDLQVRATLGQQAVELESCAARWEREVPRG
jgi:hypothetical protein